MDVVIARLVEEDLEVTDDGIGPLPALAHTPRLRDLDPALTGRPHSMMDIYPKRELGWG